MSQKTPNSPDNSSLTSLVDAGSTAWAVPLWITSVLSALFLTMGLSVGLRGAYIGSGKAIYATDFVASVSSQISAILTIFLLVQLGLRSLSYFKSLTVGAVTLLVTLVVCFELILAHRLELPEVFISWSMLASGIVVLLAATYSSMKGQSKLGLLLSGLSMLLGFLGTSVAQQHSASVLSGLVSGLQSACLSALLCNFFVFDLRKGRHATSLFAIALGTLVYFAGQRNDPESPGSIVIVRSLRSVLGSVERPQIITWGLCVAAALLVVELFRNRPVKDALLYFCAVLACAAPSIMTASCLSLAALALVEMEAPVRRHLLH